MVKNRVDKIVKTTTILFLLLAGLPGCGGDGLDRAPLSGKVTFDGRPVADGQIRFVPKPGSEVPLVVEPIRAGRYETSISGGVPVGSFRVEIFSWDPNVPAGGGPGAPPRPQFLPAKYNTQSTLELTVDSGQKPITQDFELTR